jgi:YD repeat-containing protein
MTYLLLRAEYFCISLLIPAMMLAQNPDPNTQLRNMIPVSPNAASLGSYGNIPVDFSTGRVNISIPIFEEKQGGIAVNVGLSYNYNGLKVEDVPSWVGLGWSLNCGGSITRAVRGTADDGFNGYMKTQPRSVEFIIDNLSNPTHSAEIKEYLRLAAQGLYDLEPDLYYFNFGPYSGKFYYDQESQKFWSLPRKNLKIEYDANANFIITTSAGQRYFFEAKETTTTSGAICAGSPPNSYNSVTTAWMLTKIEDLNAAHIISFEYANSYLHGETMWSGTKYFLKNILGSATSPPDYNYQLCNSAININGKKLTAIRFASGFVKFHQQTAPRCDIVHENLLENALDRIEIYTKDSVLLKTFKFDYGYFGNANNSTCTPNNSFKLRLNSVMELAPGTTTSDKKYQLQYEAQDAVFPPQQSYAQDYWGYYNGAAQNTDLIPPYVANLSAGAIYLTGADRLPREEFARFGILNKIIYPTGGHSLFEYEQNDADTLPLMPNFVWNNCFLEGDHTGTQTYYEKTFVINYGPDYYNGFNVNGGAYADASFTEIGCSFPNGQATNCAVLTIEGQTPGATGVGPITGPVENFYLPNGTYKIKAAFNQNPAQFQDFYFSVKWREAINQAKKPAGGLRIKKIIDHNGIHPQQNIIRRFVYNKPDTDSSSGILLGMPDNFVSDFTSEHYELIQAGGSEYLTYLTRNYFKRSAYSNNPLLMHSGSYVLYKNVAVWYGDNAGNGKECYTFNHVPDLVHHQFPFATMSREWKRGHPVRKDVLKKNPSPGGFELQSREETNYTEFDEFDANSNITRGLKHGIRLNVSSSAAAASLPLVMQRKLEAATPEVEEYETQTGFMAPSSVTNTTYPAGINNGAMVQIQHTTYNSTNHSPASTVTQNSKQQNVTRHIKYVSDYAGTSLPTWLQHMKTRGMVDQPVEIWTVTSINGASYITSGVLTLYNAGTCLPQKVMVLKLPEPLPAQNFVPSTVSGGTFIYDSRYADEVLFNAYDVNNNLLQQRLAGNVAKSYVYDYQNTLPVAECVNATAADIAYTSFEADGQGGWAVNGNAVPDATAPGGRRCHHLYNGTVSRNVTPATTYIVSYWKKGAVTVSGGSLYRTGRTVNGWVYVEYMVNGATAVTLNGTGYIDELRLHPKNAQMTSYTYQPLVGLSSQADMNGNIMYYEYDALGRLKYIRDMDRQVIKAMDYQLQKPITQ